VRALAASLGRSGTWQRRRRRAGVRGAAAVASLRLADARLVMATDPRAAVPHLQGAAELARAGGPTVVLAAWCHLAAAQWAVGDRSAARLTLDRVKDIAATGEARAVMVRKLKSWKPGSDEPPPRRRTLRGL
jgi:hypothetical protein